MKNYCTVHINIQYCRSIKTKRVEQLQPKRKLNNYNNKERLTTFKNKEMYEYTYSIRIATKEIEELQNYN